MFPKKASNADTGSQPSPFVNVVRLEGRVLLVHAILGIRAWLKLFRWWTDSQGRMDLTPSMAAYRQGEVNSLERGASVPAAEIASLHLSLTQSG